MIAYFSRKNSLYPEFRYKSSDIFHPKLHKKKLFMRINDSKKVG